MGNTQQTGVKEDDHGGSGNQLSVFLDQVLAGVAENPHGGGHDFEANSKLKNCRTNNTAAYGGGISSRTDTLRPSRRGQLPEGVQFVLNTLPVDPSCVADGDGFTAYVKEMAGDTNNRDPQRYRIRMREAEGLSLFSKKRKQRLQRRIQLANEDHMLGFHPKLLAPMLQQQRLHEGNAAQTPRRWIRPPLNLGSSPLQMAEIIWGIDAPELNMEYGKKSKNGLVKLIGGKCVEIHVYGRDPFYRYIGDIYCDGVFIQEQMLKRGFAWHYKKYDNRPELAQWEREAKMARLGLWSSDDPQKPWDWKRDHPMNKKKENADDIEGPTPGAGDMKAGGGVSMTDENKNTNYAALAGTVAGLSALGAGLYLLSKPKKTEEAVDD